MLKLINFINGKLQHPIKHIQLTKVCNGLNITPEINSKLGVSVNNAWFSGFLMQRVLLIVMHLIINYLYLLVKKIKFF